MPDSDPPSRQQVLDALGAYQKRGRVNDSFKEIVGLLIDESDRGSVVILGSLIEDLLLERLLGEFVELTSGELKNLTRGGGLLNNFDDKINLARALGVIDSEMVETLQVIKAMRNACAHSRLDIGLSTPELRNALALFYEGENAQIVRTTEHVHSLRLFFIVMFIVISSILKGDSKADATAAGQRFLDRVIEGIEEASA